MYGTAVPVPPGTMARPLATAPLLLLLLLLAGSTHHAAAQGDLECWGSTEGMTGERDLFPLAGDGGQLGVKGLRKREDFEPYLAQAKITEANDFTVHYFETFKILKNLRMDETYVLYQCGTVEPSGEPLETALSQVGASQNKAPKMFSVPLKAVAVEATIPIAMMEDLGLIHRVSYLPSYVATSCSQLVLGCQESSFNDSLGAHVEAVDAVIRSDTAAFPGSYPAELEPKVIQFSASQDPGALARVEWHKFLGLFFNKDLQAEELYEIVADSMGSHVANANSLDGTPTKVAWCTYNAVSAWNPVATVVCHVGGIYQYKKDLIEAAGGELLDSSSSDGNSIAFNLDEQAGIDTLRTFLLDADAVVDETYAYDNDAFTIASFMEGYQLTEADTEAYKFMANQMVYRVDKAVGAVTGGLDWFQTAIGRPDLVVDDLLTFVSPSLVPDSFTETHFMRNIAAGELTKPMLAEDCSAGSCATLMSGATICPLDVEICSDGGNYMEGKFRSSAKGCTFDDVCNFPGLKDRAPMECATGDQYSAIDNAFPLTFNGGKIAEADNIEDGSELPLPASVQAIVNEAEDFAVIYFNMYKVVINKRMSELYILYQCGLMPPFVEEVEALLQTEMGIELSDLKAAKFFSIPLQNVAVEATIPIAMMEDLGLHPRIDFLSPYVASACSQKLLACQESALDYSNSDHMETLDAVFRSDSASWPGSYPAEAESLVIQFSASQDPGALKRAEWHKFIGLFFNKDLKAEAMYDEIEASFNSMHESANAVNGDKTVLAWCTYNAVSSWNLVASVTCHTGGTYQYKKDLVEAAGGTLLDSSDSDGSAVSFYLDTQAGIDALRSHLLNADVVVDETYSYDNDAYTMASFMEGYQLTEADTNAYKFLSNLVVLRVDKAVGADTGGLDWFQTAIGRPDLVVKDLLNFVTPEATFANHEPHFFRNIASGELTKPISPDDCRGGGCASFTQEIADNPICPLDVTVCPGGAVVGRNSNKGCAFDECPTELDVVSLLKDMDDDAEVSVVSATFTMADLSVADFNEAMETKFKQELAAAASVPPDNVIIKSVTAGSVVVEASVVFPSSASTHFEAFESKLTSEDSAVIFSDSFGAVAVTEVSTETSSKSEVMSTMDSSATALAPLFAALATLLAIMVAVPLM